MKKLSAKLVTICLLTLISLVVMVMATYAWISLSGNPEIAGIVVNIGGTNTIRVAPDITEISDGTTVHHPGYFNEKVNFSAERGYEYLKSIIGLSPYSTADGINWFSTAYNDSADDYNSATFGDMVSMQSLTADSTLSKANWSAIPADATETGCYAFLDFWVVAPFDNCSLRISAGEEGNGSSLVEVKEPMPDNGTYKLDTSIDSLSLCSRVGFLVNNETTDNSYISTYASSTFYSDIYRRLLGVYPEKGQTSDRHYDFMIYEPNADKHSSSASYVYSDDGIQSGNFADGSYVITKPLAYDGASVVLADISDRLSVQKSYSWKMVNGDDTLISQIFDTFLYGKDVSATNGNALFYDFYNDYLSWNLSAYMSGGQFIKRAPDLYRAASDGQASAEAVSSIASANAPEEAVITVLNKNEPQRIRMFVWIEGQDADCVNNAAGKSIAVNIELAGSN